MSYLYSAQIDFDLLSRHYENLLQQMPEDRRNRLGRFRRFEDAGRSLCGHLLVRLALHDAFQLSPDASSFCTDANGKPFLDGHPGIHFNLSHSGNRVLAAVGTHPLGADVEKIKPVDLKIAERFFSRRECQALHEQPPETRTLYFHRLWTLKESYVKAVGLGLRMPLHAFCLELDENGIRLRGPDEEPVPCHFFQTVYEDAVLAACCLPTPRSGDSEQKGDPGWLGKPPCNSSSSSEYPEQERERGWSGKPTCYDFVSSIDPEQNRDPGSQDEIFTLIPVDTGKLLSYFLE